MASSTKRRALALLLLALLLAFLQNHFISRKWVSRRAGEGVSAKPGVLTQADAQTAKSDVDLLQIGSAS